MGDQEVADKILSHKILAGGLVDLGIDANLAEPLSEYLALLTKWNKTYNLTAVRDPVEMVSRHFLDSLSILPYISGDSVIDLGTGAGLPGIPLALALPKKKFVLIDSNGKKTRFLTEVVQKLGLENVDIIESRIEKFQPESKFDTLTSRAFSAIGTMIRIAGHLCSKQGRFVAMKGQNPEQELAGLAEIPGPYRLEAIHEIVVPELEGKRHVVVIRRS